MENFKLFCLKNCTRIFKIQIFLFLFFILFSLLFNLDTVAHKYYNQPEIVFNFHGLFSLLMIGLFGIFFWIAILYPIIWLIQVILIYHTKVPNKNKLTLIIFSIILYFISVIALISLYSIDQHQGFIERANNI